MSVSSLEGWGQGVGNPTGSMSLCAMRTKEKVREVDSLRIQQGLEKTKRLVAVTEECDYDSGRAPAPNANSEESLPGGSAAQLVDVCNI